MACEIILLTTELQSLWIISIGFMPMKNYINSNVVHKNEATAYYQSVLNTS